ncbi:hypothetical protein L7F22_059981 [Adiantum nelumboides]|nr:hypothetical protein [Adiantum nelumboides]
MKNLEDGKFIFLMLYVDDMMIASANMQNIKTLKEELFKSFSMKDLGAAKRILGMKISRDRTKKTLKLSEEDYIKKVLKRFAMQNAKPISTPLAGHFKLTKDMCPKTQEEIAMSKVPYAAAVGSLMYAMVWTRPDIAHAMGVVSKFMENPGKEHWAVKWILRYLKGTTRNVLYFGGTDIFLEGYADADMAGDKDTQRSTTGYVFTIGVIVVSWASKLQKVVSLSTMEAKAVLTWLCTDIKPLVDAVTDFSHASRIPSFFVSFVFLPIVSNASESISSIIFSSRTQQINISLTYSQIYGAVTMNNTMSLGTLLAIIYAQKLEWNFSSEVLIICLVTLIMGVLGLSKRVLQVWVSSLALLLYPLSIAIVFILDYIVGWK